MTPEERKALTAAAAVIGSFYEWIDSIEKLGGTTSLEGIARCHAFIKSMNKNRSRVDKLVLEPLAAALKEQKP